MEGRKQLAALLVCCIATVMIPCAAWAKIIYVDDDANAPGNGLSWQTAYKYLQDGLADAQTVDKPVEIRVARGVYKPDRDAAHPRGGLWSPWTFELHGGMSLRGGFAGMTAPDPNEQDANSYETTLTGDLADNDADLRETFEYEWPWDEPTHQDNVITVVEISGPGAVLLEGFTVTGGFNSSWGMIASGLPYGEAGGGVLVYSEADAVIRDCHITRNYAEEIGGGVAVAFAHSARLENCVITSNMVEFDGGGMCWMEVARVELMGCTFTDNWAGKGGAVGAYSDVFEEPYGCSACVSRCIFTANMAYSYAAGLLVCSSSGAIATEVTNCIVEGNWILNPGAGAGVRAEGDAKVVLRNCIIRHNNRLDHYSLRWPRDLGGDGTLDAAYCNVLGGWPGEGNIDADPLYARPGYWDPNGSWEGRANAFWVPGDYHLRSRAGRWDPAGQSWVTDEITSPCIDAGDPNTPVGDEPQPHGGRVNMGAYGGTACASKSPSGARVNYVGSGTPNDPYLIYTPERLRELAVRPQEWDKHFKLMADIDMGGDQACQKNTIGVDAFMPFSGVFDGNGHTISGFAMRDSFTDVTALFGYVTGSIRSLGLLGPAVKGGGRYTERFAGALVGVNLGTVANCYARDVNVVADNGAGGLVCGNSGSVTNCYASGAVSAGKVGGLVESNYKGVITNCYAACRLTGGFSPAGGLVCQNGDSIIASFWDMEASGCSWSAGGTGKSTAEMQKAHTFLDAGWDFVGETTNGTEDIWWIDEGRDYPRMWWETNVK